MAETGSIGVTRDGKPVSNINELDCVDGQVWAKSGMSDTIVRIDPATGKVNAVVDAQRAGRQGGPRIAQKVLNGIAHIEGDEFLITGKYWRRCTGCASMFRLK